MSWLGSAAQKVRRTDRSTKSRKARRVRNDRRAIFFEALEPRHLLSVTFVDDETLGNDSLATAQGVVSPGLTAGVVDMVTSPNGSAVSGDDDFYSFQAAVSGELSVSLAYVSGVGGAVQLYDASDSPVAGGAANLDPGNPLVTFTAPLTNTTGAFKLGVTGDVEYQLRIWNPDREDDGGGNNNSRAAATNLGTLGSIPAANLQNYTITRPDRDYFSLTSNVTGPVEVRAVMPATTGLASQPTNLGIRIRDAAGAIIASSNGTQTDVDTATFNANNGDTYYVEVYSGSVGQVNQYDLEIQALTGEIHGYKFIDRNGNEFFDAEENAPAEAVQNWQIYLDSAPRNQQYDAGEPLALTAADGSYGFSNLTPGTYYVREVLPATYSQTLPGAADNYEYAVSINRDNLYLDHIDFGNMPLGSLTVVKDSLPDDPADFSFSGTSPIGSFQLDDDTDGTLPNSQTFSNLTPGVYVITEAALSGWRLTDLVVSDPDNGSSVDLASRTATIDVDPGEAITVTFTNTKGASITVIKDGVPEDEQDFTYTVSGSGLTPFTLDDDPGSANPTNSHVFVDLAPGTFTITEDPVAGWTLTSIVVTGAASYSTLGSTTTVTLAAGENVEIRYTNTKLGTITVVKDAVPDDGADFSFSGTSPIGNFQLDDDAEGTLPGSQSFGNLAPGVYVISEAALSGWSLTDLVVSDPDNGSSVDLVTRTATIDVDAGESITVTFTNTKQGRITVIKDGVPDDEQDFTYTVSGSGLTPFTLDDDPASITPTNSHEFVNLAPGTFTITEDPAAGWTLTSIVVTGAASYSTLGSTTTVNLAAGEDVTIRYTNTKLGSITVVKDAIPNAPQDFAYSGSLGAFSLDDDSDPTLPASQFFGNLTPGTYVVTEAALSGWDLTSLVINDPDGGSSVDLAAGTATIDLDPGETITVTFTNTQRGSITVVKDAVPNDPQDFSYSGTLGAFSLDDDSDPTLPASQLFGSLTPGTYVLTEAAAAGWDLTSLVIVDPDGGSSVDLATGTATIDLDPGETVTVTFTNTKRGQITVQKDVVPTDPQDFCYTGGLGPFCLDGDSDPPLSNAQVFANWIPGTYRVTQTAMPGWDLTGLVINDPDGGSSVDLATGTATIDLDPGEAITVTFTNIKRGSITVIKDAVPNDPQDFSFSGGLGGFSLDDDADPTLPASQFFGNLTPGTYVVTEAALAGWDLTGLVINDPDGGSSVNLATGAATIDLDPGEAITVTFTNTKRGSITVVKDAVPNDPQDFSFSGELGAFSLDDDSDPTLPNSQLFANLNPGVYVVTEAAALGWTLSNIVIADPDGGSSVDSGTGTATIDLDPGETITVTFTNTVTPAFTGTKFYDQDPDGLGPLGPDGVRDADGVDDSPDNADDEIGLPDWTIELYQDDGDLPAPPTFEPDSPFAPAWPLTGLSQANPAVVTSANHGLVTGDRVQIAGVAGMTQVNGQIYRVTVINSSSFSLGSDDPLATSTTIDSTGFGAYTNGGTFVKFGQDKLLQTTVTNNEGNYALGSLNLPTGWYHIREVVKSGWEQTSSPRVRTVYFDGTGLAGLDFGNASCTGTLNLPNGTYPVASIRNGLLTIVYPLSSFTVDRIEVPGLDDDNDGTVDEPGEIYQYFDAYDGSGGVLAGVSTVTARSDAAGWRVDILIGANDYLHAGQHPTPPGSQFQVHITASPGAGTLTVLNAVNVDVAGSLALQITGTECGELIAVGDDKSDGANSDAKAIYFGTVEGVYNGGANLTSEGVEYDKAIMDAMFGSPSISRVEIAALDGDDIVRVKEEINQQQMLNAGAGDDTVHSGSGKSQVFGGAGVDLLVGGAADDVIYGEAGDDRIFAGAGDDRVFGGLGDDYIGGFLGNDSLLKGEDGNDRISGGDGRDRLYGDAGTDIGYRDAADLLVYQIEPPIYYTPPDPVELALRELVDTYWSDTELTDGDEDGEWDTLDELIAQILP